MPLKKKKSCEKKRDESEDNLRKKHCVQMGAMHLKGDHAEGEIRRYHLHRAVFCSRQLIKAGETEAEQDQT